MRIRGLGRLRKLARQVRKRFAPFGLILLYHRVAEVGSDPWSLCVSPRHFAEHLEVLRKITRPVHLHQLTDAIRDRECPHRPVVVTFDDGYADNLYNAKPLLELYSIPATVFVTSGHIGHEREFWTDELDRLLLQPGTLPATLLFRLNGSTYQWELGTSAHYSEDAYQHHRCWRALNEDNPTPRQYLYRSLYQLLRASPEAERRQMLDELLVWAGADPEIRPTHRFLTKTEVSALGQGNLIEIGAHSVTHPLLADLPAALQENEIQQSKTHLEEILGNPVSSFAYPHGNYTAQTRAIVQEAGFSYACSTVGDVAWRGSDHFQLPRFQVEDWDGEEFASRLSRWFHS